MHDVFFSLIFGRAPKLGPRPTSGARCGNLEDQCSPFPLTSASKQGAANDQGQRPLFELGSEGSENSLSAVACFAFVVSVLVNAGAM
jgi:hypothetical protein